MAFLIDRERWRRKPQPGSRLELDPTHPLVQGLVGCWIFNEIPGDPTVIDYAGNNDGTMTGSSVSRSDRFFGQSLRCTGNNSTDRVDLGSIAPGNPLMLDGDEASWDIECDPEYASAGSDFPRAIDKSDSGSGTNGWAVYPNLGVNPDWGLDVNGSRITFAGNAIGNLARERATITKLGTTRARLYNHDRGGGLANKYIEVTSGIPVIPSATTNAAIGNWNHSSDREWAGWLSRIYVWNRELSPHEVYYVQSVPYSIFRPRRVRTLHLPTLVPAAPSGPGASTGLNPVIVAVTS